MSKSLLVTRPQHDITTNYLFFWSKPIIDLARGKGFLIHDLSGTKATKKNFESHLRARKPSFLFLNGHGSESVFTGHDNVALLELNENEKIVGKSIIYARSCKVGALLGNSLVQNGAKAFIGYTKNFSFMYLEEFVTKPNLDSIAALFLEASNLVPHTILKGNSVRDAFERSQKAWKKALKKSLSSSASREEKDSAPWLFGNMRAQIILGDVNSCLD